MRLNKYFNYIILKINLDIDLNIKLVGKFAKFLLKSNDKIHKFNTYNKVVNNLIHKNK